MICESFDLQLLRKLPPNVQLLVALADGRFLWDWRTSQLKVRYKFHKRDKRHIMLDAIFTKSTVICAKRIQSGKQMYVFTLVKTPIYIIRLYIYYKCDDRDDCDDRDELKCSKIEYFYSKPLPLPFITFRYSYANRMSFYNQFINIINIGTAIAAIFYKCAHKNHDILYYVWTNAIVSILNLIIVLTHWKCAEKYEGQFPKYINKTYKYDELLGDVTYKLSFSNMV